MEILLKIVLTIIAGVIIAKSINMGKKRGKLFYGRWLLWIGLGSLAFVALMLFVLIENQVQSDKSQYIALYILIASFTISGLASILEYCLTKGEYSKDGLKYRTPWSGKKEYRWYQIDKIEYNQLMHWYIMHTDDGKKMRFSSYLTGVDDFIEHTLKMGHDIDNYIERDKSLA